MNAAAHSVYQKQIDDLKRGVVIVPPAAGAAVAAVATLTWNGLPVRHLFLILFRILRNLFLAMQILRDLLFMCYC